MLIDVIKENCTRSNVAFVIWLLLLDLKHILGVNILGFHQRVLGIGHHFEG